jgi:fido (protein-threonine AMPylation protein)
MSVNGFAFPSITTRTDLDGFEAQNIAAAIQWTLARSFSAATILSERVTRQLHRRTFPADEIAVRFSHRLVVIHCFPNGNGRHARLMADVIARNPFRRPVSAGRILPVASQRDTIGILEALRGADRGDLTPLPLFSRS